MTKFNKARKLRYFLIFKQNNLKNVIYSFWLGGFQEKATPQRETKENVSLESNACLRHKSYVVTRRKRNSF